mgnify:CR=1 FL=1
MRNRILIAAALLVLVKLLPLTGWVRGLCCLAPYFIIGYDVLRKAALGIVNGQVFDENFLMALATVGAYATGEFDEAVFVMLFYQTGELFQDYAVGKSRTSIAALMDIRPDTANLETENGLETVDPEDVAVGSVIVVKPGERVPLDGTVLEGSSTLDTAALTGESLPRSIRVGDDIISGCVNLTGLLRVTVTKPCEESTVSKILELVENSSEKKAVSIALQNLARNSGYGDVTRLTWSMETELIKELLPYLTPKEIDGVEVYVQVSEEGKSEIKQIKAGKELNSMPAKLKKHPYVEELKAVHKKLKDQYTRSRIMLEQAMEDCTRFEESELRKLMQNPVIWPLLKHLVFICNGQTGFYTDGLLVTANAVCLPLKAKDELRIAHPTDLYASGNWHAYQKFLFDKAIRQPFKQVFRELYVPTSEEAEATQSRRYAGNQIQPQKTIAVLKGRRWVADYEDGLQKIYYKENIIANIYAMADWFSPADIEAPTLEYVCFYNRKDYKPMKISEIPPVVFSEVMRDVDLAVSVAHAGSVDPETSHSTIEMRSVLVELTMPLFHFNNVKVEGNFVRIEGKLGKYNIHLGSGVIHQEGGAQIAVLPVHSQNRGRLFLPFVDEDPKTAEILTKIIFFAEDDKIKDPSILNQIK